MMKNSVVASALEERGQSRMSQKSSAIKVILDGKCAGFKLSAPQPTLREQTGEAIDEMERAERARSEGLSLTMLNMGDHQIE